MIHESEHVALMRRVSYIFQTFHKCTVEFSDWKVTNMTVAELQDVVARQQGIAEVVRIREDAMKDSKLITVAVTKHGDGAAVRTVKTVRTTMENALNLYDPFIMPQFKGLANGPNFERGESYGPEWRSYFYGNSSDGPRYTT